MGHACKYNRSFIHSLNFGRHRVCLSDWKQTLRLDKVFFHSFSGKKLVKTRPRALFELNWVFANQSFSADTAVSFVVFRRRKREVSGISSFNSPISKRNSLNPWRMSPSILKVKDLWCQKPKPAVYGVLRVYKCWMYICTPVKIFFDQLELFKCG